MAPYRGVGRIQNTANNAACTAGFAVTNGAANYMLTAGHCGRPGGTWNNGNDTRFFGTGARENVGHDLLLISAPVGRYMWWDTVVGVNEFVKRVVGSNDAFPGEWVCTSGATSGGRCGFKVSNNFQLRLCGYNVYGRYECYNDLVAAEDRVGGSPAARGGDSGGPVFGLSGSSGVIGSYGVIAKGTITADAPAARGTG